MALMAQPCIFTAELGRLRLPILVAGLGHLAVLAALAMFDGLFISSEPRLVAATFAYALGGLLLGVLQIASYRRGDLWSFLLHRPQAPRRIAMQLVGAAALALALAVLLPLLVAAALAVVGGDDLRHLLLAPYAWGVAVGFYLAGVVIATTPWRGAVLATWPVLLLVVPPPLGGWVFLPLAVIVWWLGWLALSCFRVDLTSPPRDAVATAGAVVPSLFAAFWGLWFALLLVYSLSVASREAGWSGVHRFGWNDYFPAGTQAFLSYRWPADALRHGLAMGHPGLLDSTQFSDAVIELVPPSTPAPRRHQLLFDDAEPLLEASAPHRRWIFRHDAKRFRGSDLRSGADLGWLGVATSSPTNGGGDGPVEDAPFPAVPGVTGDGQIVTGEALYLINFARRTAQLRFQLPAGETLLTAGVSGTDLDALASDAAVYLFAAGQLRDAAATAPAVPWARVPLDLTATIPPDGAVSPSSQPGDELGLATNLERIVLAKLDPKLDPGDVLLSLIFGARGERDLAPRRQLVAQVNALGEATVLVDSTLNPGPPAWVRHRGFLISPLLQTADDLVRTALWGVGHRAASLADLAAHPPPRPIVFLSLLIAVLSATLTHLVASRRRLSTVARRGWTVAALLAGPPVLVVITLFTDPLPRPDS